MRGDGSYGMQCVKVCEMNNIEPESAKRLISQPLKEKLEAEATGLNMVNRGNHSQGAIPKGFFDK